MHGAERHDGVHHFNRLGSRELPPPAFYGTSKGQGTRKGARGCLNIFESQGISLLLPVTLPLSLSSLFATFALRTVQKRPVAPRGGIWKVFDVLAIRGENARRLIPKSPGDKLTLVFFSLGKKYLLRRALRARANKAFIQTEMRHIDVKFFSQRPICRLFTHLPAKHLNLLERFLTSCK